MSLKDFTVSQYFIKNSLIQSDYGLLKVDRFVVKFMGLPASINNDNILTINAIAASIPDISTNVAEMKLNSIRFYYYQTRNDDTFSITFLDDGAMTIRNLMFKWLELGFNQKNQTRKYFDDVKAQKVEIAPILAHNKILYADIFEEVIPTSISSINYDVTNYTEIYKITVQFKYIQHYIGESSLR